MNHSLRSLGTHRMVEALKHAFAMRMNLGDPDWVANVTAVLDDMLSPAFNEQLRAMTQVIMHSCFVCWTLTSKEARLTINQCVNPLALLQDDTTLPIDEYGAKWSQLDDSGTTHVSVVDANGDAVALTSTINTRFGSKVVSP